MSQQSDQDHYDRQHQFALQELREKPYRRVHVPTDAEWEEMKRKRREQLEKDGAEIFGAQSTEEKKP